MRDVRRPRPLSRFGLACVLLVVTAGWDGPAWSQEPPTEPDVLDLTRTMIDLEGRGDKRRAWEIGHRIVVLAEDTLGGEHPTLAVYLDHLGVLGHELGEGTEAEQLLLRALSIQEQALGFDHAASKRTIRHLAALYRQQGASDAPADIRQRMHRYRADHAPLQHPLP